MRFVAVLLLALVVPAVAVAQDYVDWTWTAPTEGAPVVYYVIEVSVNGGAFAPAGTVAENAWTMMDLVHGNTYIVRVAGVDALDRMGPFSAESDPYTHDAGAPGPPGRPFILVK